MALYAPSCPKTARTTNQLITSDPAPAAKQKNSGTSMTAPDPHRPAFTVPLSTAHLFSSQVISGVNVIADHAYGITL
jgi:hypothetical protein